MTLKTLACTIVSCAALSLPAMAADYIQPAPMAEGVVAPTVCANQAVLSTIDRRFDYSARHYLHSNLDMVGFHGAHEVAERPADPANLHLVGRTYCEATVVMNDNVPRPLWYEVETTMGFAGIGDNVEYCVGGLDPWRVYGAYCLSVRP